MTGTDTSTSDADVSASTESETTTSNSATTTDASETSTTTDGTATSDSTDTSDGNPSTTTGGTESSSGLATVTGSSSSGGQQVCGDGVPDPDEICDDGNAIGGDGCEADCTSSDDVEPIWTLELGGPTGYVDCGTGVVFDADGNLILGAYTEPDVIWIRKLDVDLVELWTVTYPGQPGGSCPWTRVAVDADGNVGFTGGIALGDPSISGVFFGMLDPDGGELWTDTVDDPGSIAAVSGDVAFDGDGSLLLAGGIVFEGSPYGNPRIAKHDPLGGLIWSDVYNDAALGSLYGVDADADANVLIAGVIRNELVDDNDIFVRKYDPDGVVQWTDIVAGPEAGAAYDYGNGIASWPNGDIVAGGTYKPLGTQRDAWVRRYSPAGAIGWTALLQGTEPTGDDNVRDLATASDGSLVVAGSLVDVVGGRNYWVARLDANGTPIWQRRQDEINGDEGWLAVAVAADGRVAVAGVVGFAFPFDYEARFAVYPP